MIKKPVPIGNEGVRGQKVVLDGLPREKLKNHTLLEYEQPCILTILHNRQEGYVMTKGGLDMPYNPVFIFHELADWHLYDFEEWTKWKKEINSS